MEKCLVQKDELLKDKTLRVKFFDLIVPIIPFINQSNASDQLTTLIEKNQLNGILSSEFTEDVVSFINDIDMRLLINIFLEYVVFKESLRPELNQDSLFSIVTYKNLFPEDFSKLYRNEGDLFELLNSKTKYIKELKSETEIEIEKLEKKLEKQAQEFLQNADSLRRLYLLKIIEKLPTIESIEINNNISVFEYLENENFELLLKSNTLRCYIINTSSGYIRREVKSLKFSDIEQEVNSETTFEERLATIKSKQRQNLTALNNRLDDLRKKINEFDSFDLTEIFKRLPISNYTNGYTNFPLVKSLVINGYINENYRSYISLFHEVSISQTDFNFLNTVLTGGNLAFDFKLEKRENLLKKIHPKYFQRVSILNFEVLDELINNDSFDKQKSNLFSFLSDGHKDGIRFIHLYINRGKNLDKFFKHLCANWEGFWDNIISFNYSEEKTHQYLKYIIQFSDKKDFLKFDLGLNPIGEFIENSSLFFESVKDVEVRKKVKELLHDLNIRIRYLPKPTESTSWLFEYVYENNLYQINEKNIASILNIEIGSGQIYTCILNSELHYLIDYITQNIDFFVENVLLNKVDELYESEDSFKNLMNDKNIDSETKEEIVTKQQGVISNLSDIDDFDIKKLLLFNFKILPTWNNVYNYYESIEIKDQLEIDFPQILNTESFFNCLYKCKIEIDGTDEKIREFFDFIIQLSGLSFQSFVQLAKRIPYVYDFLDYEKLSKEKVEYAINIGLIRFDIGGINKLSDYYPEQRILLFEKNQEEFLEKYAEFELHSDEIVKLLDSNLFEFSNKFELIKKMDENLVVEDLRVARRSCDILAMSPYFPLSFSQLEYMFKYNSNWEAKLNLLIMHFQHLGFEEVKSLSSRLTNDGYYSEIFKKQHKPTFEINSLNKQFFELLEAKSYIRRFEVNRLNKGEYRVIANY